MRRIKPGEVRHRMRMGGIAICGVKERDGAKFATQRRMINCPACLALVATRQAAAKRRSGVA